MSQRNQKVVVEIGSRSIEPDIRTERRTAVGEELALASIAPIEQGVATQVEVHAQGHRIGVLRDSTAKVGRLGESDEFKSSQIRIQGREGVACRKVESVHNLSDGEEGPGGRALQRMSAQRSCAWKPPKH